MTEGGGAAARRSPADRRSGVQRRPGADRAPLRVTVRVERSEDHRAVHALNERAFGRPNEADLVDCLRRSNAFVPGLSLVAEDLEGRVVGHLMLSYVVLAGGPALRVLSLAPMAVEPEVQGRGVGSRLVLAAIDAAETREEPLIVLLGHPWFYPRFGFEPASRSGIEPPHPVPDQAFMVRRLGRWSPDVRGKVIYPDCFAGVD